LEEKVSEIITPAAVEQRLFKLSLEIDKAQVELDKAEEQYVMTKAKYEISVAKARIALASVVGSNNKLLSATEKEDKALIANEDMHLLIASAEILVKAARANVARIKTQVDITRSIGSSVRSSMEVS
jgi:ABC-type uncharacterized transport system YnjBCD substrate-binding protein